MAPQRAEITQAAQLRTDPARVDPDDRNPGNRNRESRTRQRLPVKIYEAHAGGQLRGLLDRERQRRQRAQRSRAGPLHERHDRADQSEKTAGGSIPATVRAPVLHPDAARPRGLPGSKAAKEPSWRDTKNRAMCAHNGGIIAEKWQFCGYPRLYQSIKKRTTAHRQRHAAAPKGETRQPEKAARRFQYIISRAEWGKF